LVFHVFDDGFVIGFFVEKPDHAEDVGTGGEDIAAAIGIALEDTLDIRDAADAGDAAIGCVDEAEADFFFDAASGHFTVALLENVEREERAREEHDV
jgi:hypothetical protein